MLILTRRIRESIIIADNIKIKVLEIGSSQIKIGIDAPKDVNIRREELPIREKNNEKS